jgi:predicted acylesterase/phospholipase RssA
MPQRRTASTTGRLLLAALTGLLAAGCSTLVERTPVPAALIESAEPVGFEGVRFWGDFNDPARIEAFMLDRARQFDRQFRPMVEAGETPRTNMLALSGGGQYGAFAAGVLNGWSETGERPVFDAVSGISTGAIIAPFAFLGEAYDPLLEEFYTTTSTEDMLRPTLFSGIFRGSALADTTPLRNKIAEYVTEDLLTAIAAEHRKGRLLVIGTTNLDAGRSVMWNMGAIAASGRPGALQLFRDIILASAAIPIAFPPVFFDVVADDGAVYTELHVDGGVTSQVNALSPQVPGYLVDEVLGFDIDRTLYVIVNGAVTPPPEPVRPRTLDIGNASLTTIWYAQTVGDLFRIHAVAERDDVATRYAWIPADFTEEPEEAFDPIFMRQLFDLGRDLVRNDALWADLPPNYTARGSTAVERGLRPMPTL